MGKDFRDGFRSYVRTEVPANNRKGRRVVYVYHGQMYHFAMTAHAFRALKAELFVLSLIWAAVQVGAAPACAKQRHQPCDDSGISGPCGSSLCGV